LSPSRLQPPISAAGTLTVSTALETRSWTREAGIYRHWESPYCKIYVALDPLTDTFLGAYCRLPMCWPRILRHGASRCPLVRHKLYFCLARAAILRDMQVYSPNSAICSDSDIFILISPLVICCQFEVVTGHHLWRNRHRCDEGSGSWSVFAGEELLRRCGHRAN
jgi:hypothetical protein